MPFQEMTKLLNEMGSGELANHIVINYKNPENFPRSNPKRLKEKPLIYNMEKIPLKKSNHIYIWIHWKNYQNLNYYKLNSFLAKKTPLEGIR